MLARSLVCLAIGRKAHKEIHVQAKSQGKIQLTVPLTACNPVVNSDGLQGAAFALTALYGSRVTLPHWFSVVPHKVRAQLQVRPPHRRGRNDDTSMTSVLPTTKNEDGLTTEGRGVEQEVQPHKMVRG
ncbi:unnamed protein product [Phytophthora lilii]|uniref:Unnamed protein product n=1 Tax=Phytophthora lilii TaxID=2077276 RepID=A0A9W6U9M2_9STRA|nr:unnamed protein product [Phytophthora lilii]